MKDSAVLHIYFIAHFNIMYIASKNGIEPDGTFIAHGYLSNDGSVGCYETIFTKLWIFPLNAEYGCHKNATFVLQFNSYYARYEQ
jgi:hypothetical protein